MIMEEQGQNINVSNKKYYIIAAIVVAAALFAAIMIAVNGNETDEPEINVWPEYILTKDIPEFRGEYENMVFASDSVAAYYSAVTSEEIAEYVQKLYDECGIDLNGEIYPRAAVYGERIIVLHYNVTEREFSVTVAVNGEEELITSREND